MKLFTMPWDVDMTKISAETWLWHGEKDNVVPLSHSQRHANQIKNCKTSFLPDEGHFSLPYRHLETILSQFA